MVEGPGQSRIDGPSGDGYRFSDRLYSGTPFKAHDGTIIDSRKKHREYMKRHNLTTADDFKDVWAQKTKEREEYFSGQSRQVRQEWHEALKHAVEKSRAG
jgi:hypothetical protein